MERKCWSSREAQSRVAGEEGTLGHWGSTSDYLPPSIISGRLSLPGRPEGKADNGEVYDTVCADQHGRIVQTLRREEISHSTMLRV